MIFFLIAVLSCFSLSSCLTVKEPAWDFTEPQLSIYIPRMFYNYEEAISNIYSSQSQILVNGQSPNDVYVDRYFIKMKFRKVNVQKKVDYVPVYYGYFVGWNYRSYSGGYYNTSYVTIENDSVVDLSYRDIDDFVLSPHSVYIHLKSGKALNVFFTDLYNMQKFCDSLYSILVHSNMRLPPVVGFAFSETRDSEKLEPLRFLNKDRLVYVEVVLNNSPAKLAGLGKNNILLEINDQPIPDLATFSTQLNTALSDYIAKKKPHISLKVLAFKEVKDKIEWEERLVKIKPIIR